MFSSQTGVKGHNAAFPQGRRLAFPVFVLDLMNPVKAPCEGGKTEGCWNVLLPSYVGVSVLGWNLPAFGGFLFI